MSLFNITRQYLTVLQSDYTNLDSINNIKEILNYTMSTLGNVRFLSFCKLLGCKLTCSFLIINDIKHVLSMCVFFFEEMSARVFCPFSIRGYRFIDVQSFLMYS